MAKKPRKIPARRPVGRRKTPAQQAPETVPAVAPVRSRALEVKPPPAPLEPPLSIREMTIDDLPVVFHIGEDIFTPESAPTLYRTWDEYEVTTLFNTDGDLCLVAERGEEVEGFALGTIVKKKGSSWTYGYVIWLGVKPDVQRGRTGERLFNELKRRMHRHGVRILMMDTDAENKSAIKFFKKQGFGKARKHIYMSLNLDKDQPRS